MMAAVTVGGGEKEVVIMGAQGIERRCWQQQGGIWFFWGCVCVEEVVVVAETKEQGGGQEGGRMWLMAQRSWEGSKEVIEVTQRSGESYGGGEWGHQRLGLGIVYDFTLHKQFSASFL